MAELSPPIQEGQLGLEDSLAEVVLANRHEGQTLLPIKEFPCFVFVCRPLIASVGGVIDQSDVEILGWGELYKSAEEAENHAF